MYRAATRYWELIRITPYVINRRDRSLTKLDSIKPMIGVISRERSRSRAMKTKSLDERDNDG